MTTNIRSRYTVKISPVDGGKWFMATITRGHNHVCISRNFVDRQELEVWCERAISNDIEQRSR